MNTKRIVVGILCFILIVMVAISAYTKEKEYAVGSQSIYLDAGEKIDFAAEKQAKYRELAESGEAADYDFDIVNELILAAGGADEEERAALNQQLERYGVYEFPAEVLSANEIMPVADGSGVVVNRPVVYYCLIPDNWSVTTGGHWTTSDFDGSIILSPKAVGGSDGFGVTFTESSDYNSSVVSVSARLETPNGDKSVTTSNRSDGNGKAGFGFELQDKYVRVEEEYQYLGYRWYGVCYYDSDFASFGTMAASYYIHTYDSSYID